MDKVPFTYNSGRTRNIPRRDADLLVRLRKGTYQTRDMVAAPTGAAIPLPFLVADADAPNLSSMSADELRELARARGIAVHHRAGEDKLRAALQESAE